MLSMYCIMYLTVVIVDPGINNADNYQPYQDGVSQNIFIKVYVSAGYDRNAYASSLIAGF